MLVGVLSDTHGHQPFTREAARLFESLGVVRLLHCGDIGSTEIVEILERWPVDYVLGNVDDNRQELEATIDRVGQTYHGRYAELELADFRVAILHGDDTRLLQRTIEDGAHPLVCHGHTHVRRLEQVGSTLVLNPGAVYRANPRSIAVVRLPELEVTHIDL